jgi:hypothetical protein
VIDRDALDEPTSLEVRRPARRRDRTASFAISADPTGTAELIPLFGGQIPLFAK